MTVRCYLNGTMRGWSQCKLKPKAVRSGQTDRCETAHIWCERVGLRLLLEVVVRLSLFSRELAMNKLFLIAQVAAAFEMANAAAGKLPSCISPELSGPRRSVAL